MKIVKFLKENGVDKLSEFDLQVKKYHDRIVLNYPDFGDKKIKYKFDPMVSECRGLILSLPDFRILCRSFNRFYNFGEDLNSSCFPISSAICYEKLDGSLIQIYHDFEQWNSATRGTAFGESQNPIGMFFNQMVYECIGGDINKLFPPEVKDKTFVFELVSPYNRIVKRYQKSSLYLLMIKDKETGNEMDLTYCDNFAKEYGFKRPKVFRFKTIDEILKSAQELKDLDEGYVCHKFKWTEDGLTDNWRIKIKSPAYVAISYMRNAGVISKRKIIDMVFKQDYHEYLSIFPEDQKIFQPYIDSHLKMLNDVNEKWDQFKDITEAKEFAKMVDGLPINNILFSIFHKRENTDLILSKLSYPCKERLIESYK